MAFRVPVAMRRVRVIVEDYRLAEADRIGPDAGLCQRSVDEFCRGAFVSDLFRPGKKINSLLIIIQEMKIAHFAAGEPHCLGQGIIGQRIPGGPWLTGQGEQGMRPVLIAPAFFLCCLAGGYIGGDLQANEPAVGPGDGSVMDVKPAPVLVFWNPRCIPLPAFLPG